MKISLSSLLSSPSKKSEKNKSRHVSRSETSDSSSPSGGSFSSTLSPTPTPPLETTKSSRRELEAVLRRLRPHPPTEDEVRDMLAEADCMSLDGIASLGATTAGLPELEEVFAVFDRDQDGVISAEELRELFVTLGDGKCSIEDCRRMIGGVDSDGDGFVCFDDFVKMMGTNLIPLS